MEKQYSYLETKYLMSEGQYKIHKAFVKGKLEQLAKPHVKDKYKRETVLAVAFSPEPQDRHRDIDPVKDHKVILDHKTGYSLADDKKEFPSIFDNEFVVGIKTNKRTLITRVYQRYKWNNADILGVIQILVLCSKDDRRVILGSGIHDFLLEYKSEIYDQFREQDPTLTVDQFRWITSDAFKWLINSQGMGIVKSTFMANVLDFYQKHAEKKKWKFDTNE